MTTLQPQPLTPSAFAAFGAVIEAGIETTQQMNSGTFQRFDDLASVAVQPSEVAGASTAANLSIVRAAIATPLPHSFNLVECHPLCSQAFIPRSEFIFYVVVGPAGDSIAPEQLRAFVSNGRQGISYHPGTWHMPLIAQVIGQEFLVVDQSAREGNLREHILPTQLTLTPH